MLPTFLPPTDFLPLHTELLTQYSTSRAFYRSVCTLHWLVLARSLLFHVPLGVPFFRTVPLSHVAYWLMLRAALGGPVGVIINVACRRLEPFWGMAH